MGDLESGNNVPSTSRLSKQGLTAVACAAGGIFLIVLQLVSRFRVLGLIVGAVVCVIGIGALMSKDPTDRKPGAVITAAGVLALLSKVKVPWMAAFSGTLLTIGAIGLLAVGIYNGVRFLFGLKDRS
jgi:hypothetical protein